MDRSTRVVEGKKLWSEGLLGMAPFLIFGLSVFPYGLWFGWVTFWPRTVGYLLLLLGFGVGWVKGFPRWSYPYVAIVLMYTLWWTDVATPGLTLLNHTFRRGELWGLRAWIPFSAMAAICLLLTRSLRPLLRFFTGVWRDWTRLSFGLYGLMPLLVWVSFDEVNRSYQFPYLVVSMVLLAGGALAYMRGGRAQERVFALLAGLGLAWTVTTIGVATYWHGRQDFWMREPGNGYQMAGTMLIALVVLGALVLTPAALGFLRRLTSLRRASG